MKALPRLLRSTLACLAAAVSLGACAAQPKPPSANTTSKGYPGRCNLVGIEQVPATVDEESDSVVLIARYSLGKPAPARSRLAYKFQIQRARENDLRLHLQTNPNIVCEPDRTPDSAPEFEGQRGQPVPEPAQDAP